MYHVTVLTHATETQRWDMIMSRIDASHVPLKELAYVQTSIYNTSCVLRATVLLSEACLSSAYVHEVECVRKRGIGNFQWMWSVGCRLEWCPQSQRLKQIWSFIKLYIAYNDAFRQLLQEPRWCSASQLFVNNNVSSFAANIRKLVYSLWRSLNASNNVLVSTARYDLLVKSSIFRR